MAIKAVIIPIMPMELNFSLKMMTPIMTVANKLKTDQIVPTIDIGSFDKWPAARPGFPEDKRSRYK